MTIEIHKKIARTFRVTILRIIECIDGVRTFHDKVLCGCPT